MRLRQVSAESLREKLSAALLVALVFLLRSADAQQGELRQRDARPAAALDAAAPREIKAPEHDAAAIGAPQPADPPKLARLRYAGRSFREWQELYLTDLEPATRLKALPALRKFGRYGYAREAAETIAAAFVDDDSELVEQAKEAVASIGPQAIPAVVELCKHNRGDVRWNCVSALKKMGPLAENAVPALCDMLATLDGTHEDDGLDASFIYDALDNIGAAQLPALLERLDSPNRNTRVLAANLAGQLGPKARRATLLLRKAFKDEDAAARSVVGVALWKVAPDDEKVVAALRDAIAGDEPRVAQAIARAVADSLPAAPNSDQAGMMMEGMMGMQQQAIMVVDAYGQQRQVIVSRDSKAERLNGLGLLAEAMRLPAFGQIFSERPSVIVGDDVEPAERLKRWEFSGVGPLGDRDDVEFANQIYNALRRAGPLAEPLVPELIGLAQSSKERVAAAAADILGTIGPGAAPAVPVLKSIIERRSKQGAKPGDLLLHAAQAALGRIEGAAPPEVELPGRLVVEPGNP